MAINMNASSNNVNMDVPQSVSVTFERSESDYLWKPNVDSNGDLSWSKTSDVSIPETQNIMGAQGEKGEKGDTGAQGIQGEKGDKGDVGAPGTTDYNELTNKPTIPTKTSDLTNDSTFKTQAEIQAMINAKFDSIVDGDEVSY